MGIDNSVDLALLTYRGAEIVKDRDDQNREKERYILTSQIVLLKQVDIHKTGFWRLRLYFVDGQ